MTVLLDTEAKVIQFISPHGVFRDLAGWEHSQIYYNIGQPKLSFAGKMLIVVTNTNAKDEVTKTGYIRVENVEDTGEKLVVHTTTKNVPDPRRDEMRCSAEAVSVPLSHKPVEFVDLEISEPRAVETIFGAKCPTYDPTEKFAKVDDSYRQSFADRIDIRVLVQAHLREVQALADYLTERKGKVVSCGYPFNPKLRVVFPEGTDLEKIIQKIETMRGFFPRRAHRILISG